jgi:hypothetical protein
MKKILIARILVATMAVLAVASCADETTRPTGPTSTSGTMPWNTPVAGQGQGQFGMLPQNQHRR